MKGGLEGFPLILVGNKCDEDSKREVSTKTGEALQVCWRSAKKFYKRREVNTKRGEALQVGEGSAQ